MKKVKQFMMIVSLLAFIGGCTKVTRPLTDNIEQTTQDVRLSDDKAVDKLVDNMKHEQLALSLNETYHANDNMPFKESYDMAKKIVEFDIEPETGNELYGINYPPNDMRTGKLLLFHNNHDKKVFVETLTEEQNLLFDVVGVDTNDISPICVSSQDRPMVLILNKFISPTKADTYKQWFLSIDKKE